jgi:hypothetical protein
MQLPPSGGGAENQQDGAAPVLVTGEVVEWVRRVAQALVRYGEGEYARAAALAMQAQEATWIARKFAWLTLIATWT